MSRGTLRSVLPRRSGRRRVLHRKRHGVRLVLGATHAGPAARAKRGAVGYLSSALGAIHRISRLSSQPQCARVVLPTTPYERNLHSCCATLPPQKMIRLYSRLRARTLRGFLRFKSETALQSPIYFGRGREFFLSLHNCLGQSTAASGVFLFNGCETRVGMCIIIH